mmetsp:Transcript_9745/g.33141  ORF Transcript_9745/g.33141 Transcript_9745/m.33141 type:complete len:167 (-) Transcript_9745:1076-1576(-)
MADTSGSSSTTYAFMATLLISAAPSVLLCAIPSKAMHQHTYGVSINRVMLAFAASSLLSDVFLHMSPFLFGVHTHGPQETCPAPCLHGEHDHDRDPHDAHGHDHDHDHDHGDHNLDGHARGHAEHARQRGHGLHGHVAGHGVQPHHGRAAGDGGAVRRRRALLGDR